MHNLKKISQVCQMTSDQYIVPLADIYIYIYIYIYTYIHTYIHTYIYIYTPGVSNVRSDDITKWSQIWRETKMTPVIVFYYQEI